MPRERPILFSAEMVRAILAGRKTQTRRLLKWKPREEGLNLAFSALSPGFYSCDNPESGYVLRSRGAGTCWNDRTWPAHCPYGLPGDRLWVKEEHYRYGHWEEANGHRRRTRTGRQRWRFVADTDEVLYAAPAEFRKGRHHKDPHTPAWHKRLARFMPRVLVRHALEITEVRVQRLHEISDDDARAEGVEPYTPPHGHISPDQRVPGPGFERCRLGDQPHRLPFADLWNRINGELGAPWDTNPWVWAISFRLATGKMDATP